MYFVGITNTYEIILMDKTMAVVKVSKNGSDVMYCGSAEAEMTERLSRGLVL